MRVRSTQNAAVHFTNAKCDYSSFLLKLDFSRRFLCILSQLFSQFKILFLVSRTASVTTAVRKKGLIW